jgi:hypothetical protein
MYLRHHRPRRQPVSFKKKIRRNMADSTEGNEKQTLCLVKATSMKGERITVPVVLCGIQKNILD